LEASLPDSTPVLLDNGQHILIGAYTETLNLMKTVGVDPNQALLRLPLELRFPDRAGLCFADWPSPWDALWGIVRAPGWSWGDRWSLLCAAAAWRRSGFACDAHSSVAQVCRTLTARVMNELIEPLCVSALNTPAQRASGQVFLTVLRDSLFAGAGGSNLLLPRVDLGALFPQAAADWLQAQGGHVRTGHRAQSLHWIAESKNPPPAASGPWELDGEYYDSIIWATSASAAVQSLREVQGQPDAVKRAVLTWCEAANALTYEAITTVYAFADGVRLPRPMLSLPSNDSLPAQFVFDRGQLGGPKGLLAFVVSASGAERDAVERQVLAQGQAQLHQQLQGRDLGPVQTVVEKRATFACTPALSRPAQQISHGLWACGDYIEGPYPATLEGAVRSGISAAAAATSAIPTTEPPHTGVIPLPEARLAP
jgi:squalene-associated FAD-dependent desaturase